MRECVSECSSVSVELDLRDSCGTWGDPPLVSVRGFWRLPGFLPVFVSVSLSLRVSQWGVCAHVSVSAHPCKCCPLVVEASRLTFSRLSEKFLAGHVWGHLSVSSLPSQSGVHTLFLRPLTRLHGPLHSHSPPLQPFQFSLGLNPMSLFSLTSTGYL